MITKYNRTDEELQEFWYYCILLSTKNHIRAYTHIKRYLCEMKEGETPFEYTKRLYLSGDLPRMLKFSELEKYKAIGASFLESCKLDLRTCSIESLLNIYDVTNKLARFFILHSREGVSVVVLDSHILRYLRHFDEAVPIVTPINDRFYLKWEEYALATLPSHFPGKTLAEIDSIILLNMANRLSYKFK